MKQFLLMSNDKSEVSVIGGVVGHECDYIPGFHVWGTYYNGDRYGLFPVNGVEVVKGTLQEDISFLTSLDCKIVEIL